MVQLAPDASPLSHCLQPKNMHKLVPLAWTGHFVIEINPRFPNNCEIANI